MDTRAICEAAEASHAGTASFPENVARLIEAGVEYYFVDYVGRSIQYYDGVGGRVVVPITFDDLPAVAAEFNQEELRAAILGAQQSGLKWPAFSRRATAAGVQGYFAFLRGQRVTYLGRTGDSHTEWFPDADPKK